MLLISLAGYFTAQMEGVAVPEESEAEYLPAAAEEQRTASDCRVTWEFKYETCGHMLYAQSDIPEDMKGLTLKELEGKFNNIKVLDFSPKSISLQKSFRQYCPDHLILKAYDGVLGVFKNEFGTEKMVLNMRLAIPYESVPDSLKPVLYYGAVFNSMEDMQSYITKKINP